jgi:molybdate transport system substrate-binding protein
VALFLALLLGPLPADDIRVYCAISLTDAMRALQPKFESITTDRLIFELDGSGILVQKLAKGAPADVFVSADGAEMDKLDKAGLINPATRHDLLFNRLVVVVPVASTLRLNSLADLAGPGVKHLAVADPSFAATGIFAKDYLEDAGVWDQVKARIYKAPNVRAALTCVEDGCADAGIVYLTDAEVSRKVKIALELPDSPKVKISYPVAALAHAPNPAGARKFIYYLENNVDARATFAKYGFILAPTVPVK